MYIHVAELPYLEMVALSQQSLSVQYLIIGER